MKAATISTQGSAEPNPSWFDLGHQGEVDRTQIAQQLRLTPTERLRHHESWRLFVMEATVMVMGWDRFVQDSSKVRPTFVQVWSRAWWGVGRYELPIATTRGGGERRRACVHVGVKCNVSLLVADGYRLGSGGSHRPRGGARAPGPTRPLLT